jgi:hypothetical protein
MAAHLLLLLISLLRFQVGHLYLDQLIEETKTDLKSPNSPL